MKTEYIITSIIGLFLLAIGKPAVHLIKTKWNENIEIHDDTPAGFTNDASRLNLTKIDSLVYLSSDYKQSIKQIQSLLNLASRQKKTISIAGGKYSMGGHTIYPNGIVLDMNSFKTIQIDTFNNVANIGAGARWSEVIDELDKYKRSVKVMQAFSSFSIGGSISVNGHGWQKNTAPISSSIISMLIMKADGEIVKCSLSENQELFRLVIGGYGLFGIILEAELKIVENSSLKYASKIFPSEQYLDYFNKYIKESQKVELVYGRLDITKENFLNTASLHFFTKTDKQPNVSYQSIPIELKRIIFRGTVNNEYGKNLRTRFEKYANYLGEGQVLSRNELLNESVKLIENRDSLSVDILHEYFIPDRNINCFINELKETLPHQNIDLLNITIRDVDKDSISFMNYAKEHVFGFVFLFNQPKTSNG